MKEFEEAEILTDDIDIPKDDHEASLLNIIQEKEDIIKQKDNEIKGLNIQIDWYESIIEAFTNLSKRIK